MILPSSENISKSFRQKNFATVIKEIRFIQYNKT